MSATSATRERPLLFQRLPALRERIAWMPLAAGLPTPVEPLRAFDLPRLFVKRDDRTSPLYGGNKVRKLEWLLADARRRGARAVMTGGAWGSHHALATALFAREAGLRATLYLWPQPRTPHVDEILAADRASGARILRTLSPALIPWGRLRARIACLAAGEGLPYSVPMGGSDALGTLGYVEAGLEVAAQVEAGLLPPPDAVLVAAGTCGTLAGLVVGLGLAGFSAPRVVGVRVVPAFIASEARVRSLVSGALALLGLREGLGCELPRFEILGDQLGRGYGHETPAAVEARDAARVAGLETDTTYTAKALAGVRVFASTPERREKVLLYVHTLGHLPGAKP
ncbi:MAG TPA: pyridoxal-phosphate dependent enzyme [Planctomycetota bacterium]|nr:pyridoxal-phosphate dependent enzyme [Planctomycetota bacterium]